MIISVPSGLSVPKVHKSKVNADTMEDGHFAAAMARGQKHRPGMMPKPVNMQHALSTISMEEHKVLLSLERLDQLLQCKYFGKTDCCRRNGYITTEPVYDNVVIFG